MRTITIQVPDYVTTPSSIADYAFAAAMEQTFGKLVDVVVTARQLATEIDTEACHKFQRACHMVDTYLNGIYSSPSNDPYSSVIEYVEYHADADTDTDEVTWLMYISDSRDAA